MSASHVLLFILAGAFTVAAVMSWLLVIIVKANRGLFRIQVDDNPNFRMGYMWRNR